VNLPYRLLDRPPDQRVLCVDGAFGCAGLELSHWPGNRTPREFRHRLSTGAALRFAAAPKEVRERHLAGLEALVNNHYDTDGLCAAFAVRSPELALGLAAALLSTAACGDLFLVEDEASFARDVLVSAAADPERSPIAAQLAGLDERRRLQRASEYVLEQLPLWLAAGLADAPLRDLRQLWEPELERFREDLAQLDSAGRQHLPELDLSLFEVAPARAGAELPGRHALFTRAGTDRVAVAAPSAGGHLLRVVVGTRSWFDLDPPDRPPVPRFDLARAAQRLRELEPDRGALAWRHDGGPHPSPELWFGSDLHRSFEEHHAGLAPSALTPPQLLDALAGAGPS
jgi:hypothetical protein